MLERLNQKEVESAELLSLSQLETYDHIIVAFSGGKDSLACLLHLLELGVSKKKIELWHHDVDGREGSTLMDWACTRDYCRKVAEAFGLPIYYSWKVGGFEGEMLRDNRATNQTAFETPADGVQYSGGKGKPGTRLLFPQTSMDLKTRWCSSYLKIDVAASAINNQDRFLGKRTLLVTGERAQESSGRAKYRILEPHKSDKRDSKRAPRYVDQYRPIKWWNEEEVWKVIEKYRVNPHPAYRLGFGRVSCMACIFGSAAQWATIAHIDHKRFEAVAKYEEKFGKTINRKLSVREQAAKGSIYAAVAAENIRAAKSEVFEEPVILAPGQWKLPAGAFGESCGPT